LIFPLVLALASPLIPFGAQSGRPTPADAVRTIGAAADAGFSDYMVYARSGLELDYMGEEWLALVEAYLKAAKARGLHVWLYDEFNWPSGSCHGRVTRENPDWCSTSMTLVANAAGAAEWRKCRARALSANVLDRAAMDRFRALTHEVYAQRFARYFADGTIRGVFSDEPGSLFHVPFPADGVTSYRWYPGIEADYAAQTGRDLRGDLVTWTRNPSADAVWGDVFGLVGSAFRRSFCDPTRAWADRLGIVTTGHLMDESHPGKAVVCNGRPLHVLKGFSMPCVDEIYTRTGADAEWLTFASVQHAAERNRSHAAAELFALGPADLTFAKMRQMIWLAAFHKVDRYVLSLAHTSARGFVDKPHYAQFFMPIQPWYSHLPILHDEARVAAAFAARPVRRSVAVRYPERLIARLVQSRGPENLGVPLVDLLRTLAWNQVAYDLCEEDEPCKKPVVFAFDGSGDILLEGSDLRFATPDDALAHMRTACPDLGRIDAAPGVLLREYEDGQVAALNLSDRAWTNLVYRGNGREVAFDLPYRGVWRGEARVKVQTLPSASPAEWTLALDRPTLRRIRFDCANRAELVVKDPCEVCFVVLKMPGQERTVSLDGRPLSAEDGCKGVVPGYDADYRITHPMRLEKGDHELEMKGPPDDGPFLPVLWCRGDFAVEDGSLVQRPKRVPARNLRELGLADYAGEATYTAKVEVPADATDLELDVGHSLVAVSMDGRALGERAWSPYRWAVPAELRGGTRRLDVTVVTSVRPIFGEREPKGCPVRKRPAWVPLSADTMGEESAVGLRRLRFVRTFR